MGACQSVQLEGDTLYQLEARVQQDMLQLVSIDIASSDDAALIVALKNHFPEMMALLVERDEQLAKMREALETIRQGRHNNGRPMLRNQVRDLARAALGPAS